MSSADRRETATAPARLRLVASGGVFLALGGAWLGHELEYMRVWGLAGLERGTTGSMHAYMLPVGLVLAIVAALIAHRAWSSWQRLATRLDRAALVLRSALRGGRPEPIPPLSATPSRASWESRILLLGLALAILQICLYLLQENIEAVVSTAPVPGIGAITGLHWAAPLVHLDVALTLLALVTLTARVVRRRVADVAVIEALIRAIAARLRPVSAARPKPVAATSPHAWFGRHLWSRPPPALLTTP